MPLYFYLSYARADRSPDVKRFFEDISDTIRIKSGLQRNETVGFYVESDHDSSCEWSVESAEALQTSLVMVSMLSPAYLRDERAGKEWQIFEMRKRLYVQPINLLKNSPEKLTRAITPVTWIPWQGPAPRVIRNTPVYWGDPNGIYQGQAVLVMLRSMDRSAARYAGFVTALAESIIETAKPPCLRPLDSLPSASEIENPFLDTDASKMNSNESGSEAEKHNLFLIDGEFVKTLANQINETVYRVNPVSWADISKKDLDIHADSTGEGPSTSRSQKQMQKYTVFVINDDVQKLRTIEETCLLSGLFEVTTYEDPKVTLRDVDLRSFQQQEMPDLFVVDLELKGKEMTGLELIAELCEKRNVPATILAMSGYLSADELLNVVGAGAVAAVPKPFSGDELLEHIERWAEVGRKSRLYGGETSVPDPSRRQRPVFLSYCGGDIRPANFLRRNLESRGVGVWYAPTTLEPGEEWRERIRSGFTQAQIFVALITEKYTNSPNCEAELGNFLRRIKSEVEHPPLLIPVFYEYSLGAAMQNELIKRCSKYQYLTTSAEKLVDGFTTLLMRIQNVLRQ